MGIRITQLVKAFGATTIVHGLSLTVADGEFVTLLGPSGCGKTTTLRCIAGLERTDGGVIEIDGRVVSDAQADVFVPTHERELGMVFQSYAIWPHMSVAQNVAFPLAVRGVRDTREAVAWALNAVGMGDLAQRRPSELSGGQQQRVALARAIVGRPKVLLFDEPLSNLDARMRDRTRAEISRIQRELAIPAVYVTHDQAEALSMSDRIVVMEAGRIVEEGRPRTLYRRPSRRFTADFLGAANFLQLTRGDDVWAVADGTPVRVSDPASGTLGETRLAMLRSELIRIHAAGATVPPDSNRLPGTVQAVQYMGAHSEYEVAVAGQVVTASCADEFAVGDTVQVAFQAQDTHLLEAGERL